MTVTALSDIQILADEVKLAVAGNSLQPPMRGEALRAYLLSFIDENMLDIPPDIIDSAVAQYPEEPTVYEQISAAIESDNADQVLQIAPLLAQLTPLELERKRHEIKERYDKKINLNGLQSAITYEKRRIQQAERGRQKDVADIAREWAMSHRDLWGYDAKRDCWRKWNGEYWEEQDKPYKLDQEAVEALQSEEITVSSLTAIKTFERLAEGYLVRDFTPAPGLLNFRNGTLHLDTNEITGFRHEDNLIYQMPYNYDPYGTWENIKAFLTRLIPDEHARYAFMAHVGLALMGDTALHKFYALIGDRQSGKSTLLALANAACGIDDFNFVGHSIFNRDLEGKRARFKNAKRRIACIDELPPEAFHEGEELLKAMAAHSGVEMRGMHKDEHTENRWLPKLIMATNDAPLYRDYSGAIRERAIFGEVAKALPEKERDGLLLEKMRPEIGAWIVACLDLARQVRERRHYPLSAAMKRKIEEISSAGNPLKDFVRVQCVLAPDEKTSISALYEPYKTYMQDNGHKNPMASNTFSAALRTMYGVKQKHMRINGELQRGLLGIRLHGDKDPDPEDDGFTDDEPLVLTVLTVPNSTVNGTVNNLNQPVESDEEDMLTVLTVEKQKKDFSDTPTLLKPAKGGMSLIENIVFEKTPLTPLTCATDQPTEPFQPVNGHDNDQNGTVNIVNIQGQDEEPSIDQQLNALAQYWQSYGIKEASWSRDLYEAGAAYEAFYPLHEALPTKIMLDQLSHVASLDERAYAVVQRYIRETIQL